MRELWWDAFRRRGGGGRGWEPAEGGRRQTTGIFRDLDPLELLRLARWMRMLDCSRLGKSGIVEQAQRLGVLIDVADQIVHGRTEVSSCRIQVG